MTSPPRGRWRRLIDFVLCFTGGALILLAAVSRVLVRDVVLSPGGAPLGALGQAMDQYYGMLQSVGVQSFNYAVIIVAIISGAIVIASSIFMLVSPDRKGTWGVIAVVFSLSSLAGVGGFGLGAILGAVGGSIALIRGNDRPEPAARRVEEMSASQTTSGLGSPPTTPTSA